MTDKTIRDSQKKLQKIGVKLEFFTFSVTSNQFIYSEKMFASNFQITYKKLFLNQI
jgi:hypothetical protein